MAIGLLAAAAPALATVGPATAAPAETVRIAGPDGPLAATLNRVAGAAHAVVIVPGSGAIDRDGNGLEYGLHSDSYRLLAEALAAAGIAALRIDKRGFFDSAQAVADDTAVTIAGYAHDARAWVSFAADHADCVWLAGHSEGGLVALVVAQDPPPALCGLILMAAPGRPVGQLLLEQMRAQPATAALMPVLETLVADLEAGQPHDPATLPAPLQELFADGRQRFMIDLFSYDPAALAASLAAAGGWSGPVLILQGDADLQVRPHDAELLAAALPRARRADLAGATHMLKPDRPGQPFATYTDPSHPLHPALVPAILTLLTPTPER